MSAAEAQRLARVYAPCAARVIIAQVRMERDVAALSHDNGGDGMSELSAAVSSLKLAVPDAMDVLLAASERRLAGGRDSVGVRVSAAAVLIGYVGTRAQMELAASLCRGARAAYHLPADEPSPARVAACARAGNRCEYCGAKTSLEEGHLDHIKPRAQSGDDDPSNHAWACSPCNLSKGPRSPSQWLGKATGSVTDTAALLARRDAIAARRARGEEACWRWVVAAYRLLTWLAL